MEKIFDIAKDSEQSWGTLATAIDGNFEEVSVQIKKLDDAIHTTEIVQVEGVVGEGIVFGNSVGDMVAFNTNNPIQWKHKAFEIEENIAYTLVVSRYPGGDAYQYAVCDGSDKVLYVLSSREIFIDHSATDVEVTLPQQSGQSKIYASYLPNGDSVPSIKYNRSVSYLDALNTNVREVDSKIECKFFNELNVLIDNDSINGWLDYTDSILSFKSANRNGTGGARCLDKFVYEGAQYTPQWCPEAGDDWKDYKGLSDPHYAGGISPYTVGSEDWCQASANNCLYGHLGRLIKQVTDNGYPSPDIFILNIMGVNDTWDVPKASIGTVLGTVEDAMTGKWSEITRTTILRALRWYIVKFRQTYPNCKVLFKTSSQQSADRHPSFADVELPVLELMKQLSVPVIDSYAECGIMADLEAYDSTKMGVGCTWTIDGTHPNAAGYEMDGKYVAHQLKKIYINE